MALEAAFEIQKLFEENEQLELKLKTCNRQERDYLETALAQNLDTIEHLSFEVEIDEHELAKQFVQEAIEYCILYLIITHDDFKRAKRDIIDAGITPQIICNPKNTFAVLIEKYRKENNTRSRRKAKVLRDNRHMEPVLKLIFREIMENKFNSLLDKCKSEAVWIFSDEPEDIEAPYSFFKCCAAQKIHPDNTRDMLMRYKSELKKKRRNISSLIQTYMTVMSRQSRYAKVFQERG